MKACTPYISRRNDTVGCASVPGHTRLVYNSPGYYGDGPMYTCGPLYTSAAGNALVREDCLECLPVPPDSRSYDTARACGWACNPGFTAVGFECTSFPTVCGSGPGKTLGQIYKAGEVRTTRFTTQLPWQPAGRVRTGAAFVQSYAASVPERSAPPRSKTWVSAGVSSSVRATWGWGNQTYAANVSYLSWTRTSLLTVGCSAPPVNASFTFTVQEDICSVTGARDGVQDLLVVAFCGAPFLSYAMLNPCASGTHRLAGSSHCVRVGYRELPAPRGACGRGPRPVPHSGQVQYVLPHLHPGVGVRASLLRAWQPEQTQAVVPARNRRAQDYQCRECNPCSYALDPARLRAVPLHARPRGQLRRALRQRHKAPLQQQVDAGQCDQG